jgi:hypothetical protein
MRASSFNEYAERILNTIGGLLVTGQAVLAEHSIDQRSMLRGFVGGVLQFEDGSELHFREFVDISLPEPKMMYAYHYQDSNSNLIFRYDNAAHKPALPQADHKHTPTAVHSLKAPTFEMVIDEILS